MEARQCNVVTAKQEDCIMFMLNTSGKKHLNIFLQLVAICTTCLMQLLYSPLQFYRQPGPNGASRRSQ
jgi:hypothetical protein